MYPTIPPDPPPIPMYNVFWTKNFLLRDREGDRGLHVCAFKSCQLQFAAFRPATEGPYFPCTGDLFFLYLGLCVSLYLDLISPVLGILYFPCTGALFSDFVFLSTGALFFLYWGLCIFPALGPYFPCTEDFVCFRTRTLFSLNWGLCISLYWGLIFPVLGTLYFPVWALFFLYWVLCISLYWDLMRFNSGALFSLYWGL